MIFIHLIASFIAVVSFSINIEIPKKYVPIAGAVGSIAWVTYLICSHLNFPDILSYFVSTLVVAILSLILSKILKAISTIFLIPGILPTVPGIAMYRTIYALINNNTQEAGYYLLQTIFITGGIALAIFITESIKGMKIIRKEQTNEN